MVTATGIVVFLLLPAAVALWVAFSVLVERRSDRIPILLYHRLLSKEKAERGELPDEEMIWVCYDTAFAEQMRYLREQGYTALDFDDYTEIRACRKPMPPKPVIVTLDDGYLSSYMMAYPALKANGHKGVIFAVIEPNEYTRRKVEGIDLVVDRSEVALQPPGPARVDGEGRVGTTTAPTAARPQRRRHCQRTGREQAVLEEGPAVQLRPLRRPGGGALASRHGGLRSRRLYQDYRI